MTLITFAHDQAHEALNAFLSGDDDGRWRNGRRIARYVARPDDRGLAAVIVDPREYEDLQEAQAAFDAFKQVFARYREHGTNEAQPEPESLVEERAG
jgi:hypothetical protein